MPVRFVPVYRLFGEEGESNIEFAPVEDLPVDSLPELMARFALNILLDGSSARFALVLINETRKIMAAVELSLVGGTPNATPVFQLTSLFRRVATSLEPSLFPPGPEGNAVAFYVVQTHVGLDLEPTPKEEAFIAEVLSLQDRYDMEMADYLIVCRHTPKRHWSLRYDTI